MTSDRNRSLLIGRLVGAVALAGTLLVVTDAAGFHAASAAGGNPGMMGGSPPPPPPESSPASESSSPSSKSDEDHHKKPDPDWDDLDKLDTLDQMHRKRRPAIPAPGTGAGTADDDAAANAAVAAAAAARAAKPKANIDMPDAMRAERCANNKARIAELERILSQLRDYSGSLSDAEARSAMLFNDLPASSAEYALARADVKQLKASMAQLGNAADLQSQLAWHKNNLMALGCD